MSEEKQKTPKAISRREFLKDAGIVVGGTAVGSAFFLSACGKEVEVTKTVTTTAPGSTVTTTAPGTTSTKTVTTTAADNTVTVTKYTCPVCNQEFDSLSALKDHFDVEHDKANGQGESIISFTVNGYEYNNIAVKDYWTLQELLHDKMGFIEIKEMCDGYGACGSCAVIMDGKAVLSCMTLAIECDGKTLETSAGIADSRHPLIEAYIKNHCMQCGYCTPGFVVSAKALLDKNPNPTFEEVQFALEGNLCRCSTYPQHPIAVLEAAQVLKEGGA